MLIVIIIRGIIDFRNSSSKGKGNYKEIILKEV